MFDCHTATNYRELLQSLVEHRLPLQNMGVLVSQKYLLHFHLITEELSAEGWSFWDFSSFPRRNRPSDNDFKNFFEQRCWALEAAALSKQASPKNLDVVRSTARQVNSNGESIEHQFRFHFAINAIQCDCAAGHSKLHQCQRFVRLCIPDKFQLGRKRQTIFLQLHWVEESPSLRCRTCTLKHNTLLHWPPFAECLQSKII